jgi:peptidoglycan/xylan/chitin deacetylase (PgdA/CDA1 family)
LLAFLRRERFEILPLGEMIGRIQGQGEPLRGAVAFTIDDGYFDVATVAMPVFAEFDSPATTFVTTGFMDGRLWQWWDKIDFIFRHTRRRELSLALREESLHYSWHDDSSRQRAQEDFEQRCKLMEDEVKHASILALAHLAEVDLPDTTPIQYAPMSWDQLRRCEEQGMSFGPHSVTHPILSRVSADRSRWEITESWNRVRAEARSPVPAFAYPNGSAQDYGEREVATLRELGFIGAFGEPLYLGNSEIAVASEYNSSVARPSGSGHVLTPLRSDEARFSIPRVPFPGGHSQPLQYASGFERFKRILRRVENHDH